MENLDIDTKVKLLFALSASVDPDFLLELEKQAEIELDDLDRIIKYKKNGGGLELTGRHIGQKTSKDELKIKKMMEFLAEKSKIIDIPILDQYFLEEFKTSTGISEEIEALRKTYYKVKNQIFRCSDFDEITKIRMAFVSGAKIPEFVLKEHQKAATVEVDEERRITKYVVNDGSIKFRGDHSISAKRLIVRLEKWQKISQGVNKMNDSGAEEEESDDESDDVGGKKKSIDYQKEIAELFNFLIQQTKNVRTPLSLSSLAREFKMKIRSRRALHTIFYRVKNWGNRIYEMNQYDVTTKVKMLFGLSLSVPDHFLNELREYANVEVDGRGRITKYVANDGSLELEGDHSKSSKIKIGWDEKRKSKKTVGREKEPSDSEGDDVESDSRMSDEEKESDGDTDEGQEEIEEEKGSSSRAVRKSGRVLRKRFDYNNISIFDNYESDGDVTRREEDYHISNTKQKKRMRRNGEGDSIDPIQEETIDDTIKIENDPETMDYLMLIDDSRRRIDEDYDIPDYQKTVQNRQDSFDEMDIDYSINRYSNESIPSTSDNRRSIRKPFRYSPSKDLVKDQKSRGKRQSIRIPLNSEKRSKVKMDYDDLKKSGTTCSTSDSISIEREVKEEIDGFLFNSGNEFKTEEPNEGSQNNYVETKQENFEQITDYGTAESKQNPDPIKSETQELDIKMELDEIDSE